MKNRKFYDYDCVWTDIDRRKCRRVVSMKILALGMSRTGTDCKYDVPFRKVEC